MTRQRLMRTVGVDHQLAFGSLRRCRLFHRLAEPLLRSLAESVRLRRYRRGEVVFHQGDPGDSLHVVKAGSVKIVLPSREGDEAIVATLRAGDFFGELTLLDGLPRSASAVALGPTETLLLPRSRFLALVEAEPQLRSELLVALSSEVRRMNDHVEELHFLDLGGRLAARLLQIAQDEAAAVAGADGGVTLDLPYTQGDLAAMIGGTRQSVHRVLLDLEHERLIELSGQHIVIPSLERLVARAET